MQKRFSSSEQKIFAAWSDRSVYRCGKVFRLLHPTSDLCEITDGAEGKKGTLLLIGNSHADSIKTSFAKVASAHGYRVFFSVDNEPLKKSRDSVERLIAEAKALKVDAVFLHFAGSEGLENVIDPFIVRLAEEETRTVWLMPVPTYENNVAATLFNHLTRGDKLPSQNLATYHEINRDLFAYAKSKKSSDFSYYDLGSVLCHPECVLVDQQGRPAYFDAGHLTLSGAMLLENVFASAIDGVARSKKFAH
nr:SGNH hydrolase domain-containing protein [Govania unica]